MIKLSVATAISFLFITFSFHTFAQTTTKEITDKFFQLYPGQTEKAFEYAFSTSDWTDAQIDAVIDVKEKLVKLASQCGKYYGYEPLTEETAGTCLKVISFILKYEREPLRLQFYLYKPDATWRITNITFDEDLDLDLIEAGRVYRIKKEK